MQKPRAQRTRVNGRRCFAAAFAVFALLLQALAPIAIMPPAGQAVHFAHSHGSHGEHERHGSPRHDAPRQEAPACPVCHALQSGGNSIAACAVFAAPILVVYALPPLPPAPEARAASTIARPQARAPPLSA
jgi:hypothetical protein